MGTITKYGTSSLSSFSDAPEPIYGTGNDGSVTFDGSSTVLSLLPSASVYTLTKDIFCQNMTVSDSVRINPNGYRIFVKNLLTLGNASIIGFTTGSTSIGSIYGGSTSSTINSLGGSSANATATAPVTGRGGSDLYKQPIHAIRGWAVAHGSSYSTGLEFLQGGAGAGVTSPGGGVVIVAARYIASTATTTNSKFAAPGSTAGSGSGGGVVLIVSSAPTLPSNVTVDVSGGSGSANSGTHYYIQAV